MIWLSMTLWNLLMGNDPLMCESSGGALSSITLPTIDPEAEIERHEQSELGRDSYYSGIAPDLEPLYRALQKASFLYGYKKPESGYYVRLADEIYPPTSDQISTNAPHAQRPSYGIRNRFLTTVRDAEYGYRVLNSASDLSSEIIPMLKSEIEKFTESTVEIESTSQDTMGLAIQLSELLDFLKENPDRIQSIKNMPIVIEQKSRSKAALQKRKQNGKEMVRLNYDLENLTLWIESLTNARRDEPAQMIDQSNIVMRPGSEGTIQVMQYLDRYQIGGRQDYQPLRSIQSNGVGVFDIPNKVSVSKDGKVKKLRIGESMVTKDQMEEFFFK